ncbi:MAG: hypothetical protein AB7O65_13760 [Candidatus Korobacteraceae bacterium]
MEFTEQTATRGRSGRTIIILSLLVGAVGVAPLLLYIAFGPKDGNPIGLGLLAMLALPLAGVGLVAGLTKTCAESLRRH